MSQPTSRSLADQTGEGAQELKRQRATPIPRSCAASSAAVLRPAEGVVARPRRHRRRVRRGRDHDHQPGASAPVHPRGAAGHARARRRDGAALQAGDRLPAHRDGEDRRGAHVHPGGHQRHPDGLPVARSSTSWSTPWRRAAARRRGAAPGHLDPDAHVRAQPDLAPTSCGWPPTAPTSAPSTCCVYGWRERELVLAFFEKVTGLRMNHNYIRPGGVAADLPDGWRDDVAALCEAIPRRMDEYDRLLTGQPIFQDRLQGVGPAVGRRRPSASASPDRCCGRPAWRGTSAATCPTWPTTTSTST